MLSLLKAIGYMAVALGIQVLVSAIYGFIAMFRLMNNQGMNNFVNNSDEILNSFITMMSKDMNLILLISAVMYCLVLALIYKIGKKKIIEDFGFKNNNIKNLILAVFLGLSLWLIITGGLTLMETYGVMQQQFKNFEELTGSIVEGSIFITVLAVGIVVPFTEEFLFRGVVQKTLSKGMSIKSAIILQGVLFGVYHFNLIQGLYATLLGIVYGYVTYKCKSLWPAVIMHVVNNSIAIVGSYILPSSLNNIWGFVAIVVIGMVILVTSLISLNRNNLEIQGKDQILHI